MSVVRLYPRSPDTHTRSALALAVSDSTEEATRPLLFSSIQNRLRVVLPLHLRSTSSLRVVTSIGLGPLGGNRIETPAQSADCPFQRPARATRTSYVLAPETHPLGEPSILRTENYKLVSSVPAYGAGRVNLLSRPRSLRTGTRKAVPRRAVHPSATCTEYNTASRERRRRDLRLSCNLTIRDVQQTDLTFSKR